MRADSVQYRNYEYEYRGAEYEYEQECDSKDSERLVSLRTPWH